MASARVADVVLDFLPAAVAITAKFEDLPCINRVRRLFGVFLGKKEVEQSYREKIIMRPKMWFSVYHEPSLGLMMAHDDF